MKSMKEKMIVVASYTLAFILIIDVFRIGTVINQTVWKETPLYYHYTGIFRMGIMRNITLEYILIICLIIFGTYFVLKIRSNK